MWIPGKLFHLSQLSIRIETTRFLFHQSMNKIDSSCESCNFLNISVTRKTKRREKEGGSLILVKEREEGQKEKLNTDTSPIWRPTCWNA